MNNEELVKLHIDTVKYQTKPKEFNIIKPRLQNNGTVQEVKINELYNIIANGYAISPGILIDGMSASNWKEQRLFLVDIDNDDDNHPILHLSDALKICECNKIMPIFAYFTFSYTYEKPKYRLVFLMDKPITDYEVRGKVISTLVNMFSQSDRSCINADRIFLGTNKGIKLYNLDSRITVEQIMKIYKPLKKQVNYFNRKDYTRNNLSDNQQLYELEKNFDLLSYMMKDNEVSRQCENITYFKTCSICGHNDCLRYFHDSNMFKCFGESGDVGGMIVDYLMYSENLTKQQAINKFKYELCNIDDTDNIIDVQYITANDLQNMDLPPVAFYVKDLIPQGLTLICSVPKLGKSWFALQLCLAITNGQKFLDFDTDKCSCLYLALEDSPNRLKNRTMKLLGESDFPNNLYFNTNNKIISTGLIGELTNFIKVHQDIKVIVIDTLQKVRGISKTTNVYANDYKELSALKSFADKNNIAIILIHHLRKGIQTTDVFDRVSGTNGITGTADTTIILSKENREDVDTKMSVVGRDVEYNEYLITFNKDTCKWEMKGIAELLNKFVDRQIYNNNTLIKTIKELIEKSNEKVWAGTFTELNQEHLKIYGRLYDNEPTKLKRDIDRMQSKLLDYDSIIYIPSKYANCGKRVQTFKKQV